MRTWKPPLRPWKLALLALVVISAATAAVIYERSVRRLSPGPGKPGRGQAAGLFVGVQQFPNDGSVEPVRFAVDDAIDLAYAFSLDRRIDLVRAKHVVLAISGEPQKKESQERLEKLRAAGATITTATKDEVLTHLERQVEVAGSNDC